MVDALIVVLLVVLFFALMGYGHGWRREVYRTIAIIIATIVLTYFEAELVALANRFWRFFLFAIRGGLLADDPSAVFARVRREPLLINTPVERVAFNLVVFTILILVAAWFARRQVKIQGEKAGTVGSFIFMTSGKLRPRERLLGAALGAVNGYLVANFVLPRVFQAAPTTTVVIPNTAVTGLLQVNFIPVIVVLVAVILAIAVLGVSSAAK